MSLPAGFALPRSLPLASLSEALVHRLCATAHARREPSFRATRANRFDDPRGAFGTLYCARSFGTCFLETLLRGAGNLAVSRARYNASAVALLLLDARQLHLVDLFSTSAVAGLGLNLALLAGASYTPTQQLAGLIHAHRQKPDGIVYRSRFDPDESALVLFERAANRARLVPQCRPIALPRVSELADAVRNRVPFVFV